MLQEHGKELFGMLWNKSGRLGDPGSESTLPTFLKDRTIEINVKRKAHEPELLKTDDLNIQLLVACLQRQRIPEACIDFVVHIHVYLDDVPGHLSPRGMPK
ncbi:unnamed protein product [Schistocephalus solidus]|uniref:FERM domain-containing protein n=1 Tax=Schistocephalus solidus TaxID=70667 RepID=A0A183S7H7_SCHSO|nr:unnamed protein product [Schistocephalus solidus]